MSILSYEAIVVGSGATGGVAALTLSQMGIKTLVIEAGPKLNPEKVFGSEIENLIKRIKGVLNGNKRIQAQHPGYWKNNPDLYANEKDYPYLFPDRKPFLWTQGRQVGGRSLSWGGITLRLSERNFKPSQIDGYKPDWPLSYKDLEPHYSYIEKLLKIYGKKDNIDEVPNGYFKGYLPFTESEKVFQELLLNNHDYPFIHSRGFDLGNNENKTEWSISSSIGSSLKMALESGKVDLLPDHLVEKFNTNEDKDLAKYLIAVNQKNGSRLKIETNNIIFCASTISTLRILLNSESKTNNQGFIDQSGLLGKQLMDHISISRFFTFPVEKNIKKSTNLNLSGAGSFFLPFGRDLPNQNEVDFIRGYGVWGSIGRLKIPNIIRNFINGDVGFLIAHGEVLPSLDNQVSLSKSKDKWGIPIPYIEFEWGDNEKKMSIHMINTIEEIIKETGGNIIEFEKLIKIPYINNNQSLISAIKSNAPPPGYYIHEVGGAPMGLKEDLSVTDKWNRLWRCKNVFVVDGACWPTSSWQSPTLTMMAIARRACLNISNN